MIVNNNRRMFTQENSPSSQLAFLAGIVHEKGPTPDSLEAANMIIEATQDDDLQKACVIGV